MSVSVAGVAILGQFGFARTTTDWRELIADDVDVLLNLGSNDLHAEPTIAAARAGKPVLCEKPLARNAEEARSMVGWGDSFALELEHFLNAVTGRGEVGPDGATFTDGIAAADVCDAILRSAEAGHRITLKGTP